MTVSRLIDQPGGQTQLYTPAITDTAAVGGNPGLGSTGAATGFYTVNGKLCTVWGKFTWNGTGCTSGGVGNYQISLPLPATAAAVSSARRVGSIDLYQGSTGKCATVRAYQVSTTVAGGYFPADFTTGVLTIWGWGSPLAIGAAVDQVDFLFNYELA